MRLLFESDSTVQLTTFLHEHISSFFIKTSFYTGQLYQHQINDSMATNGWTFLFNYYTAPYTYLHIDLANAQLIDADTTLAKAHDIYAQIHTYAQSIQISPSMAANKAIAVHSALNIQWTIAQVLTTLYIFAILWQGMITTLNFSSMYKTTVFSSLQRILFSWIFISLDKVETTEEGIVLAILWPWCFLIVFTHLMALSDNTILFGFSEWGLPVTYGLVMLLEHCWAMGSYLFVYVAGAAGRKYTLVTALEDAVALLILIARVLLQAVRGVIVGMFHFISREMLWNMSKYWTHNNVMNSTTSQAAQDLTAVKPAIQLILDCAITGASFVIITAVMFLQLLFLLVSVWLFCKCWFTSWRKC